MARVVRPGGPPPAFANRVGDEVAHEDALIASRAHGAIEVSALRMHVSTNDDRVSYEWACPSIPRRIESLKSLFVES